MKVILALGVMLAINVFLFLGQVAVDDVAERNGFTGTTILNPENSLLNDLDSGGYVLNTSVTLPDTDVAIDSDNNNFFIDPIGSLKSWFSKVGDGWDYFTAIVNAVPNFLKNIGLPNEISFALGFFWHMMSLFLVVMLIWGRQL